MSIDYLEDLENEITNGKEFFACPGPQSNEWHLANVIDELVPKAKRTANSNKMEAKIFRLVNKMDATTGDSFLVVRKILDPGPRGEPNLRWTLVDTREAADMLRDVSQGPTPYFGAIAQQTVQPDGE